MSHHTRERQGRPRKSCLKKEDSKTEPKPNRHARFDEESISRTYLFDLEEREVSKSNLSEMFPIDAQDLQLGLMDGRGLEPYDDELMRIREARKKEFELKVKNHHRNEFNLIKNIQQEEEEVESRS
uniref:Putative membrane protein ycf1 n=1 Tax=Lygus hesperus TaxID=30085 RepID=A0A0A9YMN7_LYGHE